MEKIIYFALKTYYPTALAGVSHLQHPQPVKKSPNPELLNHNLVEKIRRPNLLCHRLKRPVGEGRARFIAHRSLLD